MVELGVEEMGMSQHTYAQAQALVWIWIYSCMRINLRKAALSVPILSWFYPPPPHPTHTSSFFNPSSCFPPILTHLVRSPTHCPVHTGMSSTCHSLSVGEEQERGEFPILLLDWFTAPNQFKASVMEGDNSHRYAEGNKTVIIGIEMRISRAAVR